MMPRWFTRPVVAALASLALVLAAPAVSAQTPNERRHADGRVQRGYQDARPDVFRPVQ